MNPVMNNIIWILLTALYSPIFFQLYKSRWENIDYTHAYLILPVSLWLAWRKRQEIRAALTASASPSVATWGMALLVLGALMFVFGWRMDYLMVSSLSFIVVLFGMILYRYNGKVAQILRFPILYLLLLVPPPLGILDAITIPMRKGVSIMTEVILKPFYPVVRDGMMLQVGHAQVFVGAPCSGFRSLVSMFALALIYVYLIKLARSKKMIILAMVIPFALVGNVIRVISLTLVTYYFGKEAGEGFFHGFSGMLIFVLLIMALIGTGKMLGEGKEI
jgi:exosortase